MADYFDPGAILSDVLVNSLRRLDMVDGIKEFRSWLYGAEDTPATKPRRKKVRALDATFLQVRNSILVTGEDAAGVMWVKSRLEELTDQVLPLESLHIKNASDTQEGALLVPKAVLVASHCPGRPLLDEEGDSGVLDTLYDAAQETGADILVVYLGLPRVIYPPTRRQVYHPKLGDLLFPTQTLLRSLAQDNRLVTVVEGTDLNHMQQNVLREWLAKPVPHTHPVYQHADYLSALEYDLELDLAAFYSETEIFNYHKEMDTKDNPRPSYLSANENATKEKKKSKKKPTKSSSRWKSTRHKHSDYELVALEDEDSEDAGIELYRETALDAPTASSGSEDAGIELYRETVLDAPTASSGSEDVGIELYRETALDAPTASSGSAQYVTDLVQV